MADIRRTASATWNGDLKSGKGQFDLNSGLLKGANYSFRTRFEQEPGTNPEELIAAAHASCYSMAFAHTLSEHGHQPQSVETQAVCVLESADGGFTITKMQLETQGQVPGIDQETFQKMAQEAEANCPVSNALRGSVKIELHATLID